MRTHVLVGHSERRQLFGESDALVACKFAAALRAGLEPILCVGETLAERDAGRAEEIVTAQLVAVVGDAGVAALERAIVAYEPVWAIGTGRSATTVRCAIDARNDQGADSCAGSGNRRRYPDRVWRQHQGRKRRGVVCGGGRGWWTGRWRFAECGAIHGQFAGRHSA